jgi:hypothetical protein
MTKRRLIRLIKVLAGSESEIVGNWFIDDQVIDSIQLVDNGFILCIWEGDNEYQIMDEQLSKQQMLDLIEQLEEILRN